MTGVGRIRVDIAMSALLFAIYHTGHYLGTSSGMRAPTKVWD